MKDLERIRNRYMRDPHSGAPGGIGGRPGRISSSARRVTGAAQVGEMIEESRYLLNGRLEKYR